MDLKKNNQSTSQSRGGRTVQNGNVVANNILLEAIWEQWYGLHDTPSHKICCV